MREERQLQSHWYNGKDAGRCRGGGGKGEGQRACGDRGSVECVRVGSGFTGPATRTLVHDLHRLEGFQGRGHFAVRQLDTVHLVRDTNLYIVKAVQHIQLRRKGSRRARGREARGGKGGAWRRRQTQLWARRTDQEREGPVHRGGRHGEAARRQADAYIHPHTPTYTHIHPPYTPTHPHLGQVHAGVAVDHVGVPQHRDVKPATPTLPARAG